MLGWRHFQKSSNFCRIRFNTTSRDDVAHEGKVCVFFDGVLGIKLNMLRFAAFFELLQVVGVITFSIGYGVPTSSDQKVISNSKYTMQPGQGGS